MAARLRLRSFAKINLDLRILNRRSDGYHELRTIFQTISLADTLEIEYRPGRTKIDINSNLNIPDNLIARAADSVLHAVRRTGRIEFVLGKRIPLGGGLGGGSSNAAAVLLGLPRLLGKPLPLPRLMELAVGLGSDVAFFLLGGTAAGLGRGGELYPLPDLVPRPALLVAPGIHVSTPEAYARLNRLDAPVEPSPIIDNFQSLAWRISSGSLNENPGWVNDFENVVFRLHPQLKSIKGKLLKLGARPALMSGSGSSIFGIFPSRRLRDSAVELFRKDFDKDKERIHPFTMIGRSRYQAIWRRQLGVPAESKAWPPQDRYAE